MQGEQYMKLQREFPTNSVNKLFPGLICFQIAQGCTTSHGDILKYKGNKSSSTPFRDPWSFSLCNWCCRMAESRKGRIVFLYVPFTSNKGTTAVLLATEKAIASAGSSESGNLWNRIQSIKQHINCMLLKRETGKIREEKKCDLD